MKSLSVAVALVFVAGLITGLLASPTIFLHNTTVTKDVTATVVLRETVLTTKTLTFTVTENVDKARDNAPSCVVFKTSKEAYMKSEEVTFIFENKCDFKVILPNPAPIMVMDAAGELVFAPVVIQVIREASPGETLSWKWDQRDIEGRPVPPGRYRARIHTLNAGTTSVEFIISQAERCLCTS